MEMLVPHYDCNKYEQISSGKWEKKVEIDFVVRVHRVQIMNNPLALAQIKYTFERCTKSFKRIFD